MNETQEAEILKIIRAKIKAAPSYIELRKAYTRFLRHLYGKFSDYPAKCIAAKDAEPEDYLSVHAGVMNAKSQACKTMKRLTDQIFKETDLPRKPQGKWRGMDGVDVEKCAALSTGKNES